VFMFKSMFTAVLMAVYLIERPFSVKLFHEKKRNASATAREFCRKKNVWRGQMYFKDIRAMIKRFKEMREKELEVQPG
ncbi:hypothetical protein TNCT_270251, partial [Trichonephila clavata]